MTAPGGPSGESQPAGQDALDDAASPPPAVESHPEQPVPEPPWAAPAAPAAPASWAGAEYPPPAYPPSYPTGYPPPIPPTGYPPPGYQQYGVPPAAYSAGPYPPMPPPYGASPGGSVGSGGFGPPDRPGGYAGGYYPAPDYLSGYGAAQPGMNTMAIISLISAFVGLPCCIGSIVAIVVGAIALSQIKQTREEGYGLAVAGIVIGVATLLVYLIIAIFSMPAH